MTRRIEWWLFGSPSINKCRDINRSVYTENANNSASIDARATKQPPFDASHIDESMSYSTCLYDR
jgi:hypothetical protein